MHEWALAEAVISAAAEAAEKEGLKEITEVQIGIGELQQIDQGILEFALSQLKSVRFKKTKFRIEKVRGKLRCRACGHEWIFSKKRLGRQITEAIHFIPEMAHVYIKCPECGSPDFEILEGRGIWLQSIKGVN